MLVGDKLVFKLINKPDKYIWGKVKSIAVAGDNLARNYTRIFTTSGDALHKGLSFRAG